MGQRETFSRGYAFSQRELVKRAAVAEIDHIRELGSDANLRYVTVNLGAYEAVLCLLSCEEESLPVFEVLARVKSHYATQTGILNRLNMMRELGLIESRPGVKKSQVSLMPSEKLFNTLMPILIDRNCK